MVVATSSNSTSKSISSSNYQLPLLLVVGEALVAVQSVVIPLANVVLLARMLTRRCRAMFVSNSNGANYFKHGGSMAKLLSNRCNLPLYRATAKLHTLSPEG